jgi:hypothetical protein
MKSAPVTFPFAFGRPATRAGAFSPYNQLNTIVLPAMAGKSVITIENYKNQIHVETIKLRR